MITRLSRRRNLKKTIFLVLILLLSTACSNTSGKSEISVTDVKFETFFSFYDIWNLEMAEQELNQLEIEETDKKILMQKLTKREADKEEFNEVLKKLSFAIKANDFNALEEYIAPNIINKVKLRELKKHDYSEVNIYFGKNKFRKKNVETIMLINYLEETLYVDLKFQLVNEKKWQLVSFKEKR